MAGVVVGVLMAPKKGTETRKMIKDKANDLSSTAKKTFDENYSKGKDALNGLTDKVKTQFDSITNTNGQNTSRKSDEFMADEKFTANKGASTAGATTGTVGTTSGTTSGATTGANKGTSTTPGGMSATGTTDKFNQNS